MTGGRGPSVNFFVAKAEGMELTDEQLEAVSGGGCLNKTTKCPECGSKDLSEREEDVPNVSI